MADWSIYTATEEQLTPELLRRFVEDQLESRLLTESMTLELKERRQGDNIARAVAAFANSNGGIVLIGLTDGNPSLDTAPGVPPSEVVAISNSLSDLLTPPVRPMIVPIPLPDRETVVVVLRVDRDESLVPVCKGGTIFVRAPGNTVPATRDQIINLAAQTTSSQLGTSAVVPTLNSAFVPSFNEEEDTRRDALVRVAGGVFLRPLVNDFVFSSDVRRQLQRTLAASALCLYPALADFRWRRSDGRPQLVEASFTASTVRFEVDYPDGSEGYRVSAQFRRDGYRIAYALDLEFRVRDTDSREAAPRLAREELATSVALGAETAGLVLPNLVSTIARSAPQRLDPLHVWLHSGKQSLDRLLDISRLRRGSENSMGTQWGWVQPVPRSLEEISATTSAELARLYLDIGLSDAEAVAERDAERATTVRRQVHDELIVDDA